MLSKCQLYMSFLPGQNFLSVPPTQTKKKTTLREDLNQSHSNRVVLGFLTNSRYSTHLEFKTVSRFSFESGKYFKKCFCNKVNEFHCRNWDKQKSKMKINITIICHPVVTLKHRNIQCFCLYVSVMSVRHHNL